MQKVAQKGELMRVTGVSCHEDGEMHSVLWGTLRMVTWRSTAIAGCCKYGNENNLSW
jgi:predicted CxxxxCH...CXXCH cytochrome family protein